MQFKTVCPGPWIICVLRFQVHRRELNTRAKTQQTVPILEDEEYYVISLPAFIRMTKGGTTGVEASGIQCQIQTNVTPSPAMQNI